MSVSAGLPNPIIRPAELGLRGVRGGAVRGQGTGGCLGAPYIGWRSKVLLNPVRGAHSLRGGGGECDPLFCVTLAGRTVGPSPSDPVIDL